MKCKDRIYKYLFYILLGIVLILIVPIIVGLHGKDIFNFKIDEVLTYYGVLISGVITLIGLKIIIENGNKTIIEQFNLQNYQRHLERYEKDIEEIVLSILNYHGDIINILLKYKEGDEIIELETIFKLLLRWKYKIQIISNRINKESDKIFMYNQILVNILNKENVHYLKNVVESLKIIELNIRFMSKGFDNLQNKCEEFINISKQNMCLKQECLDEILKYFKNVKDKYLSSLIEINTSLPLKYIRDNYNSFISSLNKFPIIR